jgi:hypothetical protein
MFGLEGEEPFEETTSLTVMRLSWLLFTFFSVSAKYLQYEKNLLRKLNKISFLYAPNY